MQPTATKESVWSSIYIAGFCAFIQATQFSIFFASMWPYLLSLDPTVTQTGFGIVVALYSFSQLMSSPAFGYWSNQISEVRLPLIVGFSIMALGNIIYLSLQFMPAYRLYFMMAARFISGATGNMSLLRAYTSSASTSKDRSRAVACVSGGLACGTMLGPGIQVLFSPLGADGLTIFGFNLSIYTSPALFCLFLNIVAIIMIYFFFDEKCVETEKVGIFYEHLNNPDVNGLVIILFTRFSQVLLVTTIESIGSEYSMMMFSLGKEEAVTINAISDTITGTVSSVFYLIFIIFDVRKYLKLRTFTIIGLIIPVIWLLTTYPYKLLEDQVNISKNGSNAGFGYSLLNLTITTLYSKIIGPRPQGTYQGFYEMAGIVSRLITPLLMSNAYTLYGPVVPWQTMIIELSFVIILWIAFRHLLVPFEQKSRKNEKNELNYC